MPKLEGENNCICEVSEGKMQRTHDACKNLGFYGFVTAVGVGFVAYSATHMYVWLCAPSGILGFVQSLVVMDSTFCQTLMGLVHHSQSLYGAMMLAFLFSMIGAISKGIELITGQSAPEIPRNIQVKGFQHG
jgi:hypothetical protein